MQFQFPREHDLLSIGSLAGHLQISLRAIERAATELQIVPAKRIDMVPYFDGGQVELLTDYLSGGKKQS